MTFSRVMFSRHFGYFKITFSFDSHSVDFFFELLFGEILQFFGWFFTDKSNGISILTLEIFLIDWRVIVEKCCYLYTHSSVSIYKGMKIFRSIKSASIFGFYRHGCLWMKIIIYKTTLSDTKKYFFRCLHFFAVHNIKVWKMKMIFNF